MKRLFLDRLNRHFPDFIMFLSKKAYVPSWLIFLLDLIIANFAFILAYLVCYSHLEQPVVVDAFLLKLGLNTFLTVLWLYLFRTYRSLLRYSGLRDLFRAFFAIFCTNTSMMLISELLSILWSVRIMPLYGFFLSAMICFSLIFMVKMTIKLLYDYAKKYTDPQVEKNIPLLIYGISPNNIKLAEFLENNQNHAYKLNGFILPARFIATKAVNGIQVYHRWNDLQKLVNSGRFKSLLINPDELDREMKDKLADYCIKRKIEMLTIPAVATWKEMSKTAFQLKKIRIEELLGRTTINIKNSMVGVSHVDKCVLVSGAAGSIGSEIARQICTLNPREIVLCDIAETPMYSLQLELEEKYPDVNIHWEIADVRNNHRMESVFKSYAPDYVYHAAAYKHVPLMERYPCEAVNTNVLGTKIMADLSVNYNVKVFVLVSTDKAVNPTNVMGCTKRVAEIYVQSLGLKLKDSSANSHCRFITTRFGNVLGSSGSVIPRFEEQIKQGGPITVTHPEITRFFMTIPEACSLVLEAGNLGYGGEIFIFDMGEAVKIKDLAEKMIRLSGLEPYKDIDIAFVGLRPGEKLYEELLSKEEHQLPTQHEKIMIGRVRKYNYDNVKVDIKTLIHTAYSFDDAKVIAQLHALVPEYLNFEL
ncbi:MAG: polysaccharide biosynthesis protein [Bacteroidales bacterium]|nr:polysaccharide biosynthesis protein [Bacteroidales bacterium]MCL2133640.1 polysaccharide biosynthesis protein [Bacteroidales bacterium]